MHRIYFDANEGDERGRFDLGIPGALHDIEPIESELAVGMQARSSKPCWSSTKRIVAGWHTHFGTRSIGHWSECSVVTHLDLP
jgi:hypothetical protein